MDSNKSSPYAVIQALPTPQEYHDLRKAAGLTPPPLPSCSAALANSVACFVLTYDPSLATNDIQYEPIVVSEGSSNSSKRGNIVGMCRLVGDGALFLEVVDMAVHPTHQRKGFGSALLKAVIDYADLNAPDAYMSMVADSPANEAFYPRFGFQDVYPSTGMFRCKRIQKTRTKIASADEL